MDGRRVSGRPRDTLAEAIADRDQLEAQRDGTAQVEKRIKFRDAALRWYEFHTSGNRSLKQGSINGYSRNTENLIEWMGDRWLDQVDISCIREWQLDQVRAGYAPGTIVGKRTVLSMILKAAQAEGYSCINGVKHVARPRPKRREHTILSPTEVEAVAAEIAPEYRLAVLFASYLGLRNGEICALRIEDIDLSKRLVYIRQTIQQKVRGKGHRSTVVEYGAPKTESSRRIIDLPQSLVGEIEAHIEAGYTYREMLFKNHNMRSQPRLEQGKLKNEFDATLERLGMKKMRFHDLRHSALTLWLELGSDPKVIATRAGHKSVAYVLDTYVHPGEADSKLSDLMDQQRKGKGDNLPEAA